MLAEDLAGDLHDAVTVASRVGAHRAPLGTGPEPPTDLPPSAGRAAAGIAIVLVAQLMLILDATAVNVALPRIDDALDFGPAGLSWVLNAYTLAFGGLLLLGGRLGDVFGRRRTFEIGLAVFTLASLAGGLAQTPEWLVAARGAQGVGAALAAPGVLALLTTSAPDEAARNRALALFGAASSGGMSLGLLLGGAVTDLGSWRWTLFINIPIGLAVLAVTRRVLDETPLRPGRFDVVGALSATLVTVSIVWALIGVPDAGLAPDDPARAVAQPSSPQRARHHRAWSWVARCRCSSSPCSTSRARSASARSPRAWPSCR